MECYEKLKLFNSYVAVRRCLQTVMSWKAHVIVTSRSKYRRIDTNDIDDSRRSGV